MSAPKPIFRFGNYHLVYRSQAECIALDEQERKLPISFYILEPLASVGSIWAAFNLLLAISTDTLRLPIWLILVIGLMTLFAIKFDFGAFLSSFRLIHTKNPSPSDHSVGIATWLYLGILVALCSLQAYLRYLTDLPPSSGLAMMLNCLILMLAVPYYAVRFSNKLK